jgi:hypothetical protein
MVVVEYEGDNFMNKDVHDGIWVSSAARCSRGFPFEYLKYSRACSLRERLFPQWVSDITRRCSPEHGGLAESLEQKQRAAMAHRFPVDSVISGLYRLE